jgi:hypothetical protein
MQFQVMVLDYKLTYPSGTATAMLINSFHTKTGAELAGYTNLTTQKLNLRPWTLLTFLVCFLYYFSFLLFIYCFFCFVLLCESYRNQVKQLGKYLSISFFWSAFKWFFSGIGDSCGFDNFPSFGLTLFKNT